MAVRTQEAQEGAPVEYVFLICSLPARWGVGARSTVLVTVRSLNKDADCCVRREDPTFFSFTPRRSNKLKLSMIVEASGKEAARLSSP